MSRKKLKISKELKTGTICGECGYKNDINDGMSVAYRNGNVHFYCANCGKETMINKKADWYLNEKKNKKRRK